MFFGTGAYTVALTAQDWHVPAGWTVFALLPLAGLVAGLLAIPVGLVALRTRRHTFVVVTIAIFFVFQLLAFNLPFTGGTDRHPAATRRCGRPTPTTSRSSTSRWSILVATVALSWAVRRSRFGLQLMAIRDDEDRARGMGVRVRRVKLGGVRALGDPGRDGRRHVRLLPRRDLPAGRRSTRCSTSRSR